MTKPRSEQIHAQTTPYYHCMVRCVRRAFLCGEDYSTGQNYDHRKQWIVSRLRFLSYVYAIDICACSVMSNHYHVIVHIDEKRAEGWSDLEVAERWLQLFNGNVLINRWMKGEANSEAEQIKVKEIIEEWRTRLTSISWFMRCVNERIAAMANSEDGVKGRFWEGRFKSQALLDEAALLTCMAYVDLNPIRAQMADSLETSDFTSIQQRLDDYSAEVASVPTPAQQRVRERVEFQRALAQQLKVDDLPCAPLMAFDGRTKVPIAWALPFTREDCFLLVEATGRVVRSDKRGTITGGLPLLERFGVDHTKWFRLGYGYRKRGKFGTYPGYNCLNSTEINACTGPENEGSAPENGPGELG